MSGRRHWRISEQKDHDMVEDVPLKILANFKKEQEWIVEPGDLLYLPPKVAHDGIALDPGTQTWSVGFRSPSWKELLQETLWRLADSLENNEALNRLMSDPHQQATSAPGILPTGLVTELERELEKLSMKGKRLTQLVSTSLGEVLSEPKPHIVFNGPNEPLDFDEFIELAQLTGIKTSAKTRLILDSNAIYCNGEQLSTKNDSKEAFSAWLMFANQRQLSSQQCMSHLEIQEFVDLIYEGYLDGWFELIDVS
jgi:50S ribosomal protein L16 3-hydroxylase